MRRHLRLLEARNRVLHRLLLRLSVVYHLIALQVLGGPTCAWRSAELLLVNRHVSDSSRLAARSLGLLDRHVAGVRAEQRVRLLALFDFFVLNKDSLAATLIDWSSAAAGSFDRSK